VVITKFESALVMNRRPPSRRRMVCMSGWLCHLDWRMLLVRLWE